MALHHPHLLSRYYVILILLLCIFHTAFCILYCQRPSEIQIDNPTVCTTAASQNGPAWDRNCTRIRTRDLEFGCHGAFCSPENEAAFLGVHAPLLMGEKLLFEVEVNDTKLHEVWEKFVRMQVAEDEEKVLETATPPDYILARISPGKPLVPRICDFKTFLYCESSLHLDESKEGLTTSKCVCNALYSVQVIDRETGTITCHGRPGVPCDYVATSKYLNPGEDSFCMQGTQCKEFADKKQEKDFRNGLTFHGYGLSPIILRYLLRNANKVCTCDSQSKDGYKLVQNKMHECVNGEKVQKK